MNLTLSPQIKIVALVGVLAAVGLAASMTVLGGKTQDPNAGITTVAARPRHAANPKPPLTRPTATKPTATKPTVTAPTVTRPAATRPTVTGPAATKPAAAGPGATRPATRTQATPAATAKPAPRGNLVYAALPRPLQWALAQNSVVVVSIYNPNAGVDAIAVAEAHAGAVDAGAGFLLVNVLDDKLAGPLTSLLPGGGLLPDPGVLVYRAPGNIALRIDGFADRTVVAQAATNARAGESGAMPAAAGP